MHFSEFSLGKSDFDSRKWAAVIAGCDEKECRTYSDAFFAKAKEAGAAGEVTAHQVFTLLGAVTSLFVKLDSRAEPFAPLMIFPTFRSAGVDDFTDSQVDLFGELAPAVSDAELRARLADVVWIRKRDVQMAKLAIDSYLQSAAQLEDPKNWPASVERITRAVQLAASIGKNNEPFTRSIAHIEAVLDKYKGEDPLFLSARLMELLQTYRQGDPAKYAALADKAATLAESAREWHRARVYLQVKARWHTVAQDSEKERITLIRLAESYVGEAADALHRGYGGYSIAAHNIQTAIEALRRIPGTRERRDELYRVLLEYQQKSTEGMGRISEEVDLTRVAEQAQNTVKGKNLSDALFSFALISAPLKITDLRSTVQQLMKEAPLQHIIPSFSLDATGKVIAHRPGVFTHGPKEAEAVVIPEMYRHATMLHRLYGLGVIEPARLQILLEHRVRVADLEAVVLNNPLIPSGREPIFAQGLQAGFEGDFLTALHLLIPQLENSIRYLLNQRGIATSAMDSDGIQNDYDLNTLLYMPELTQVFDENIIFGLKGLLVEHIGSNLRNRMAHGLMSFGEFFSPESIYLWWLVFHLCCVPILLVKENADASQKEQGN